MPQIICSHMHHGGLLTCCRRLLTIPRFLFRSHTASLQSRENNNNDHHRTTPETGSYNVLKHIADVCDRLLDMGKKVGTLAVLGVLRGDQRP